MSIKLTFFLFALLINKLVFLAFLIPKFWATFRALNSNFYT